MLDEDRTNEEKESQLIENAMKVLSSDHVSRYATPKEVKLIIATAPLLAKKLVKHYSETPDFFVMTNPVSLIRLGDITQPVVARGKMLRAFYIDGMRPEYLAEFTFWNIVEIISDYIYQRGCKVGLYQMMTPTGIMEDPTNQANRTGLIMRFAPHYKAEI